MAEEHQPCIPVPLVDQMANADVERIRRIALAVAGLLFDDAPTKMGYYAVFVEGHKPEKRLRRIAEGEHKMSPERMAFRVPQRSDRGRSARSEPALPLVRSDSVKPKLVRSTLPA